jgi:cytochrome P450 family 110
MKLPNCPRTPSLFQVYEWATRPTNFLDRCARLYGDIFMARWPGYGATVFVNDPKAIEQIFTASPETFSTAEIYEMLRPVVGDQSLMVMDGKPHRRQRSLVMPPLHGERMRLYSKLICKLTEQTMQQWKLGETIDLRSNMQTLSLSIMLQVVFGSDEGEQLVQLRKKFMEFFHWASSPIFTFHLFIRPLHVNLGPWSAWGRFLRLRQEVDELLYAEIARRREQPQPDSTDVFSLLMAARDEEGQPMSDRELRDEVMTLLTGYESTATATLCGLYNIYKHPEVLQRLREELDSVNNSSDLSAIAKLPYLTAISQETMRLYPPIVVAMRVARIPYELMGYKFPVGSQIVADIYSVHHRQDLYPNPKQFKPERFLERQFSRFEYLPFGGGNRRCIGDAFAPFQMKLVLATIVSRYQLQLTDDRPFNLLRNGGGVAPDRAIEMRVTGYHHQKPVRSGIPTSMNVG